MPVDIVHRRKQLKMFAFQVENAWQLALNGPLHRLEHEFWHHLHGQMHIDTTSLLLDVECVLIPAMKEDKEWSVLIPDVEEAMRPLYRAIPGPIWGCPSCR